MPCCLRVTLPCEYPSVSLTDGRGGRVEINSPGALDKHAARLLTQAAHTKLSGAQPETWQIRTLTDWLQSVEVYELAAASILPDRSRNSDAGFVRVFVRFHHVLCIVKQSYMRIWAQDLRVGAL